MVVLAQEQVFELHHDAICPEHFLSVLTGGVVAPWAGATGSMVWGWYSLGIAIGWYQEGDFAVNGYEMSGAGADNGPARPKGVGRRRLILGGAVAGVSAVAATVTGSGKADAADGDQVVLAASNTADTTTSISTTAGTALAGSSSGATAAAGGYGLSGQSSAGHGVLGGVHCRRLQRRARNVG